jgi:hypothetical protein
VPDEPRPQKSTCAYSASRTYVADKNTQQVDELTLQRQHQEYTDSFE